MSADRTARLCKHSDGDAAVFSRNGLRLFLCARCAHLFILTLRRRGYRSAAQWLDFHVERLCGPFFGDEPPREWHPIFGD